MHLRPTTIFHSLAESSDQKHEHSKYLNSVWKDVFVENYFFIKSFHADDLTMWHLSQKYTNISVRNSTLKTTLKSSQLVNLHQLINSFKHTSVSVWMFGLHQCSPDLTSTPLLAWSKEHQDGLCRKLLEEGIVTHQGSVIFKYNSYCFWVKLKVKKYTVKLLNSNIKGVRIFWVTDLL